MVHSEENCIRRFKLSITMAVSADTKNLLKELRDLTSTLGVIAVEMREIRNELETINAHYDELYSLLENKLK